MTCCFSTENKKHRELPPISSSLESNLLTLIFDRKKTLFVSFTTFALSSLGWDPLDELGAFGFTFCFVCRYNGCLMVFACLTLSAALPHTLFMGGTPTMGPAGCRNSALLPGCVLGYKCGWIGHYFLLFWIGLAAFLGPGLDWPGRLWTTPTLDDTGLDGIGASRDDLLRLCECGGCWLSASAVFCMSYN